jgi:hypothetical protein
MTEKVFSKTNFKFDISGLPLAIEASRLLKIARKKPRMPVNNERLELRELDCTYFPIHQLGIRQIDFL